MAIADPTNKAQIAEDVTLRESSYDNLIGRYSCIYFPGDELVY
jgi:hypothetical protein